MAVGSPLSVPGQAASHRRQGLKSYRGGWTLLSNVSPYVERMVFWCRDTRPESDDGFRTQRSYSLQLQFPFHRESEQLPEQIGTSMPFRACSNAYFELNVQLALWTLFVTAKFNG